MGGECGCSELVLLVDDNSYNVVPVRMGLSKQYGLSLKRAENGQHAFDMFKADMEKTCCDVRFQIILMDLNMPVMGGVESTKLIIEFQNRFLEQVPPSQSYKYARAPILAMTAFCS